MVSSIISNSNWDLPLSNHHAVIEFWHLFTPAIRCDTSREDVISWDNLKTPGVSISTIWSTLCATGNTVPWAKLVWNSFIPPKYSFILWLAFHNGLRTLDLLSRFGLGVIPTCPLCNAQNESFNHLFFDCPYSFHLLVSVLRHCGWKGISRNWSSLTSFLISRPPYSYPPGHPSFRF